MGSRLFSNDHLASLHHFALRFNPSSHLSRQLEVKSEINEQVTVNQLNFAATKFRGFGPF